MKQKQSLVAFIGSFENLAQGTNIFIQEVTIQTEMARQN